jgi:hypothetical protein
MSLRLKEAGVGGLDRSGALDPERDGLDILFVGVVWCLCGRVSGVGGAGIHLLRAGRQ